MEAEKFSFKCGQKFEYRRYPIASFQSKLATIEWRKMYTLQQIVDAILNLKMARCLLYIGTYYFAIFLFL